jgi:hypothetical protein
MQPNESGLLNAFDSHRDLIYAASTKVYRRGRKGSYELTPLIFDGAGLVLWCQLMTRSRLNCDWNAASRYILQRLDSRAEDGQDVATIVSSSPRVPLPPGKYLLEVGDQKVPIDLAEGQVFEINLR